jgi:hypothetical protein
MPWTSKRIYVSSTGTDSKGQGPFASGMGSLIGMRREPVSFGLRRATRETDGC